jgi:hypothetical protein
VAHAAHPSWVLLTRSAVGLARLDPDTFFDPIVVQATYRQELQARGFTRGLEQLELKSLGPRYAEHLCGLRRIAELAALPSDARSAAAEIGRLVYTPRSGVHPVRHLAFIAWLFTDLEAFVARYRDLAEQREFPSPAAAASAETDTIDSRQELRRALKTLLEAGRRISSAARDLGIDPVTAMAWAAADGISVNKRPSVIRGAVRVRMIKALRAGRSKQAVASLGGVSIASVSRLLRTEVGLHECWRTAQFQRRQRLARRRWARAAVANPISGVKAARMLEPAAYAWLYRNDRTWLDEHVAGMTQAVRIGGLHVDWDSRDEALAMAVRRTALELEMEAPGRKGRLWQLYQRLPELKAKLSKLDRLPLTRSAVYSNVSSRKRR